MVLWLIGLSGAGKTSVGSLVAEKLRYDTKNLIYLDGDILRDVWGDKLGHDIEGRRKNAERISKLCQMLDKQNQNVVAAVLSIFPEWQEWNRKNLMNYRQVYLKVSREVLFKRDYKGFYAKALSGEMKNVVGVDIPFPEPEADLIIQNDEPLTSFNDIAEIVIADLGLRKLLV